jgi:hypothetical protein
VVPLVVVSCDAVGELLTVVADDAEILPGSPKVCPLMSSTS